MARTASSPTVPIPVEALREALRKSKPPPREDTLPCPECVGADGEGPTGSYNSDGAATICSLCWGRKRVTADEFARHHARSQGRP